MKRIGQKQLSLLLCLVLLFTMAIPAGARASDYFNNTYVSATAVGGGTLRIKVDVAASGIMQELGATEIIVHERQANGTYKPVRTFTRNQNANLIQKELCFQCNLPHATKEPLENTTTSPRTATPKTPAAPGPPGSALMR